jgi:hypothetical protein
LKYGKVLCKIESFKEKILLFLTMSVLVPKLEMEVYFRFQIGSGQPMEQYTAASLIDPGWQVGTKISIPKAVEPKSKQQRYIPVPEGTYEVYEVHRNQPEVFSAIPEGDFVIYRTYVLRKVIE